MPILKVLITYDVISIVMTNENDSVDVATINCGDVLELNLDGKLDVYLVKSVNPHTQTLTVARGDESYIFTAEEFEAIALSHTFS